MSVFRLDDHKMRIGDFVRFKQGDVVRKGIISRIPTEKPIVMYEVKTGQGDIFIIEHYKLRRLRLPVIKLNQKSIKRLRKVVDLPSKETEIDLARLEIKKEKTFSDLIYASFPFLDPEIKKELEEFGLELKEKKSLLQSLRTLK